MQNAIITTNVANWRRTHKVNTLTPDEVRQRAEADARRQRWHIHHGRIVSIGQVLAKAIGGRRIAA